MYYFYLNYREFLKLTKNKSLSRISFKKKIIIPSYLKNRMVLIQKLLFKKRMITTIDIQKLYKKKGILLKEDTIRKDIKFFERVTNHVLLFRGSGRGHVYYLRMM